MKLLDIGQLGWLTIGTNAARDLRDAQRIFASEPALLGGIWLPDLAMMKQDSAGTTAAASGAVVGLVYDQSKGLALGPELVTNGDFTSSLLPWSNGATSPANSVTRSIDNGRAKIVVNTTNLSYSYFIQNLTLTLGKTYLFSFEYESTVPLRLSLYNNNSFTYAIVNSVVPSGAGTRYYHLTLSYTQYLMIVFGLEVSIGSNVEGGTLWIDNVTVKEVLSPNANQSTTANKPLLRNNSGKYWFTKDSAHTSLPTTFPSSLGNNCTVYRGLSTGVSVLTGQSIATTYDLASTDWYGSIVLNRVVSPYEDRLFRRILSRYTPI